MRAKRSVGARKRREQGPFKLTRPRSTQRVTSYQLVVSRPGGTMLEIGKRHRSLDPVAGELVQAMLAGDVRKAFVRQWYTTPTGRSGILEDAVYPPDSYPFGRVVKDGRDPTPT